MKSKKDNELKFLQFDEDKANNIPQFTVNVSKAKNEELFALQLLGYYPSTLIFGLIRMEEIIECSDNEKLYRNDRKVFLKDKLRKQAFCNITGFNMEEFDSVKR